MKKLIFQFVFLMLTLSGLSGCAITAGYLNDHPGYAEFELSDQSHLDKTLSLSLGGMTLQSLLWLTSEGDDGNEKLSEALDGLEGVRVNIYEVDTNHQQFLQSFSAAVASLNAKGWQQIISVKEENDRTLVLVKMSLETVQGLAVFTLDKDEAVFVNLIGDVGPEAFEPVMQTISKQTKHHSDTPMKITSAE